MATAFVLIVLGIAIVLRAGKLAGAATELQLGGEPSTASTGDSVGAGRGGSGAGGGGGSAW